MHLTSTGFAPTAHGGRYIRQLCSHWRHNLTVEEAGDTARITFPRDARGADWPAAAVVSLTATPEGIACTVAASHPDQRAGLEGAVVRHLDRFAFREGALAFHWQPA